MTPKVVGALAIKIRKPHARMIIKNQKVNKEMKSVYGI
tara:strand:- start:1208 stop:1321 length:114 start_codon:yes stop_codon:yes gene_type:complete